MDDDLIEDVETLNEIYEIGLVEKAPEIDRLHEAQMMWRYKPQITVEQLSRELDSYLSVATMSQKKNLHCIKLRLFLRDASCVSYMYKQLIPYSY